MIYRLLALSLLWPLGAFAQTGQVDPLTLRTRDTHQNLTIAADPYVSASRYSKDVFGKTSPYEGGVVAINVYFRNDNDSPIRVNLDTIQLMISVPRQDREKLLPLTAEEVADRAILKAQANPRASRLPFPHSGSSSGKGKAWDEMHSAIRSIILSTDVLPPHERSASTSNRNFEGRQGKDSRTHLVSPLMAAAAAIAGHFVDVRDFDVTPVE